MCPRESAEGLCRERACRSHQLRPRTEKGRSECVFISSTAAVVRIVSRKRCDNA
uniref:Uncharacterized protein n=1 Tax=Hyaloperonospora arabidopsidis (strain Emoy2) TaxID=559515 RepID=M4BTU1_HYAAE